MPDTTAKTSRRAIARQIPYTVTFPDGTSVTFSGPDSMSDADVYTRAVQERKFKTGQIPTTFAAGAAPEAADALTNAAMSGAGYLIGQPALLAGAPLAGRGARALAEKVTGQDVTPTTSAEMLTLGAQGALPAYGPSLVSGLARPFVQAVNRLPVTSVPQALARGAAPALGEVAEKASAITPQAIGQTTREVTGAATNIVQRLRLGVTSDDLSLLRAQVGKGMNLRTAARIISGGDPKKLGALLEAVRLGIQ